MQMADLVLELNGKDKTPETLHSNLETFLFFFLFFFPSLGIMTNVYLHLPQTLFLNLFDLQDFFGGPGGIH